MVSFLISGGAGCVQCCGITIFIVNPASGTAIYQSGSKEMLITKPEFAIVKHLHTATTGTRTLRCYATFNNMLAMLLPS